MAVYWVDPHATVNGTGTFASPYSPSSSTRATLVSGDEIRIKGVALTSLLTSTVYTATYTSYYQLTITAGGSLGADFAAGDIVYLPDVDAFFRVGSSVSNVISPYGTTSNCLPWYNSSSGQASITVRKVDLTTYPPGTTASIIYVWASAPSVNNITISDCWTSATTRVTDGTVKTLLTTSSTVSNCSLFIDGSLPATAVTTGRSYAMANTHGVTGNTTSYLSAYIYASGVTASLGQVYGTNSTQSGLIIGSPTFGCENVTLTLKHLNNLTTLGSVYGANISITVSYVSGPSSGYAFCAGLNSQITATGVTVSYGDCLFNSIPTPALLIFAGGVSFTGVAFNFNGTIDMYTTSTVSYLFGSFGNYTVSYGAGFNVKLSRRAITLSSVTYLWSSNTTLASSYANVPTLAAPSGYTVTSTAYFLAGAYTTTGILPTSDKVPLSLTLNVAADSPSTSRPSLLPRLMNMLVVMRDGTAPYECLSIFSTKYSSITAISYGSFPVVTTDATVYRTTGPSLKSLLTTRNTSYWSTQGKSKSVKSIKVPVTAGTTTTISGYVRTDISTYATGDCTMRAVFNNTDLGVATVASAYNAWAAFSISFTPTLTGEVQLLWEMFYAAAGSYWLDDLTVT